jgi:predicted O-methyltransferase YrrM
MLDFMHYIESCHHFLYSGCFADQGVLRALVAKHHLLKRINYELRDATNWNPTWGRADHLRVLPETGEWINEQNGKPQRIWHGAGPRKLWTSQYDSESAKRAWQSVGGEVVTRRWIDVAGSLIAENCLAMCELIRRYNPSSSSLRILEFGTQYGRTAIAMCCVLAEHGVSVHVDTCDIFAPSMDYPVGFPRQRVVLQNIAAFGLTGQIVSHLVEVNENLIRRFEGQLYDVVFIDANHQFKQVLADCVIARHLVKKPGLIIGDDWHLPDVRDASRLVFGPDQLSPLGRNMWYCLPQTLQKSHIE